MSRADNFVKKLRNLTISDPKLDLHNINAHTKFGENPFIFTQDITRKRNYGRTVVRQTAGRTDGYTDNQLETIIVWREKKKEEKEKKNKERVWGQTRFVHKFRLLAPLYLVFCYKDGNCLQVIETTDFLISPDQVRVALPKA